MLVDLFFLSAALGLYHGVNPKSQMHEFLGRWWYLYAAYFFWMGVQSL